jgi:hypothetical protein
MLPGLVRNIAEEAEEGAQLSTNLTDIKLLDLNLSRNVLDLIQG